MAGIFDLKKGAFDSSEAERLYKAFDIALQGLRATHEIDQVAAQRLARSIVKVARTEPGCLAFDGSIDPILLAQRAILRMLQTSAPGRADDDTFKAGELPIRRPGEDTSDRLPSESPARIMLKLFDRTNYAKL